MKYSQIRLNHRHKSALGGEMRNVTHLIYQRQQGISREDEKIMGVGDLIGHLVVE